MSTRNAAGISHEPIARQAYEALSRSQQPKVFANLTAMQAWRQRNERAYAQAAAQLSKLILAPAAALLGKQRLLIVPDGALHYVSFAALPECGVRNAECGVTTAPAMESRVGKKQKTSRSANSALRTPHSLRITKSSRCLPLRPCWHSGARTLGGRRLRKCWRWWPIRFFKRTTSGLKRAGHQSRWPCLIGCAGLLSPMNQARSTFRDCPPAALKPKRFCHCRAGNRGGSRRQGMGPAIPKRKSLFGGGGRQLRPAGKGGPEFIGFDRLR